MKSLEFVKRMKSLATDIKTSYASGMIGQMINETTVKEMSKYYPDWYKKHDSLMKSEYGTRGFDCVCSIKSILWGFVNNNEKYGGAKYESNGVPDLGVQQMFEKCYGHSTDWSAIKPGAFLYMQGHCGVYIGDGLGVECTLNSSRTRNGCIISAVKNIGTKSGYYARTWTEYGYLPYVDYTDQEEKKVAKYYKTVMPCNKGDKGENVVVLQEKLASLSPEIEKQILEKSFKDGKLDGSYGSGTAAIIRELRKEFKLPDSVNCDQELCDILNSTAIDYVKIINYASNSLANLKNDIDEYVKELENIV